MQYYQHLREIAQRNLTFPQTSEFLLICRFLRYSALSTCSEGSYVPFSGLLPQNCYYQKHNCKTKFNHCREPDSSLQNTYSRMFWMNIDGISVPFCHPPQQAIGYRQCGLLMISRAVTDVSKHRCIAGNTIASGVAVISAIDSFYLLIAAKYSIDIIHTQ